MNIYNFSGIFFFIILISLILFCVRVCVYVLISKNIVFFAFLYFCSVKLNQIKSKCKIKWFLMYSTYSTQSIERSSFSRKIWIALKIEESVSEEGVPFTENFNQNKSLFLISKKLYVARTQSTARTDLRLVLTVPRKEGGRVAKNIWKWIWKLFQLQLQFQLSSKLYVSRKWNAKLRKKETHQKLLQFLSSLVRLQRYALACMRWFFQLKDSELYSISCIEHRTVLREESEDSSQKVISSS